MNPSNQNHTMITLNKWITQKVQKAMKKAEQAHINKLLQEEGELTDNADRVNSDISEEDTLKQLKHQKDPISKFLRKVPPDFDKAVIHGV